MLLIYWRKDEKCRFLSVHVGIVFHEIPHMQPQTKKLTAKPAQSLQKT